MFKEMQKKTSRLFQKRSSISILALTKISKNFKYTPSSTKQYNNILVLLCEVPNVLIAKTLKSFQTADACTAIMDCYIKYYGSPTHIICDQNQAFMLNLAQSFFQHFGITILTVCITNNNVM